MNYYRNAWEKVPVMRAIIPFLAGILLAIVFPQFPIFACLLILFFSIAISLLINKIRISLTFRFRIVQGILMHTAIFSASLLLTISTNQIAFNKHFSHLAKHNSFLILKVKETPEEKENTYKMLCKVISVCDSSHIQSSTGKLLTYIRKDSLAAEIRYGDILVCSNNAQLVEEPKNPGQFDFKRFLSYKQIYHQAFLENTKWTQTSSNKGFFLLKYIYDLRISIVNLLEENISGKDESAIATALLVGYKAELSDEVKESFASTGAMHVLAVSGLHVGIIFIVFSFMFKGLRKRPNGKWLYLIINLSLLWTYAVITGLSPSVLRACSMFSFVIIGKHLRRAPNIYSSLITSAIFLLILNPYLVTQVGFQLSYAAVFGIVFFQPRFYKWLDWKRFWLGDKIWALTTVSLSAQLATFPLALFYFTIFPVYFLISNLIVIPAASIIIYVGFAYLIFEAIGLVFISKYLVLALDQIITTLNKAILLIRDWPKGLIEEVYISAEMMIIVYVIIFSSALFLINKHKVYLYFSLLSIFVFVSIFSIWNVRNHTNQRIVIYAIPNSTLIGFFDGKSVTFLGDSAILSNYELRKYNTFRDLWRHGVKSANVTNLTIGSQYNSDRLYINRSFIQFMNQKLILYNGEIEYASDEKIDCNKLILYGKHYIDFQKLEEVFNADQIVLDQSLKYKKRNAILSLLKETELNYSDLKSGAAIIIE